MKMITYSAVGPRAGLIFIQKKFEFSVQKKVGVKRRGRGADAEKSK
jgi:hypothetical protein